MTVKRQNDSVSSIKRYAKGARFENKVRDDLVARGYLVVRAAGSKGDTKIDLIAFRLGMPMMLIQAKTDGKISKAEWDQVLRVSTWYPGLSVAVLASNGPKGRGVIYTRMTAPRVLYARSQPCADYDPGPVIPEASEGMAPTPVEMVISKPLMTFVPTDSIAPTKEQINSGVRLG